MKLAISSLQRVSPEKVTVAHGRWESIDIYEKMSPTSPTTQLPSFPPSAVSGLLYDFTNFARHASCASELSLNNVSGWHDD